MVLGGSASYASSLDSGDAMSAIDFVPIALSGLLLVACGPKAAPPDVPTKAREASDLPTMTCETVRADSLRVALSLSKADETGSADGTVTRPRGQEPQQLSGPIRWEWDGHLTGTVTGEGFVMTYESHYGCIRNAELVLEDGTEVRFPQCHGWATHDEACFE